ncbi:MAG: type II toxin-antitoxin system RelE/ParE family toxin [Flavobacteriales bacterium]
MRRSVYLSPKAVEKLQGVFKYLEDHWPKKVKTDFIKKLDKTKEIISKYPESFPESKAFPGLYKCNVTRHNTLFYRIKKNDIEIVTIFDLRQHPKKLKKELRKKIR